MSNSCGDCNLEGKSELKKNGAMFYCLYDFQWHPENYVCHFWSEYLDRITYVDRVKIASDLRNLHISENNLISTKKLVRATWALVWVTAGLVIVTAILARITYIHN